ncbi:hypothetical protein PHPALM_31410 [Phytophthora palmivora]|uniref:Retrotransposon gag domain-containing protein n=1 Tax=Phytophthora palmivora TaxID=4796 RepID=A0A2P4X2N0_9STRA|nr:hypothetical protein PHPALM_31410 [Phytophthora palmivora]
MKLEENQLLSLNKKTTSIIRDKSKLVTFQVTTVEKSTYTDREFVKISIPRFSGGTAQEWLKWSQQFHHLSELKEWTGEDKYLHLRLILDNEALDAWEYIAEGKDFGSATVFGKAYAEWGRTYVPATYSEQLEEELFMFAKRRKETVSQFHQRMREVTRMLLNLPTNSMTLDDKSMIRYFKRAMPYEWKRAYDGSGITFKTLPQAVQYFERLEQSERQYSKEYGVKTKPSKHNNKSGGQVDSYKNNHQGKSGEKQSQRKTQSNSNKWCKLHKPVRTVIKKGIHSAANKKAKPTKLKELKRTHVEDAESDYQYSDDSEGKVITSILRERSNPPQKPMRLRIRLSQTKESRVALVDTGCGTSYINAALAKKNTQLGFPLNSSEMMFEQVSGLVKYLKYGSQVSVHGFKLWLKNNSPL